MSPYEHIYAAYEMDKPQISGLYSVLENNTNFRGVDRMKLLQSIVAGRKADGGCLIDVYKLIKHEVILGFYPLHDHVELRTLEEKWLQFWQVPWKQPVDEVKDYFGEKIGLYFTWLGNI